MGGWFLFSASVVRWLRAAALASKPASLRCSEDMVDEEVLLFCYPALDMGC